MNGQTAGALTDAARPIANPAAVEELVNVGCCPSCKSKTCPGLLVDDPSAVALRDVVRSVEQWHDDNHPGTFQFCPLEPCRPIRSAVDQ